MAAEMDPDTEILIDCSPMFRQYKSGRVERLLGTDTVPAGLDPTSGVTTKDVPIDSDISARLYLPPGLTGSAKLPVVIYIHGGGFCIGSAFNPNPFLTSLVAESQSLAVSVDYRLAPEHPLPAAYDDCWAALNWALSGSEPWLAQHADFSRVFVVGESAGANIAHSVAMRCCSEGKAKLAGVALCHPYFWGSELIGSETSDPTVRGRVEGLWRVANRQGVGVDDPWFNPMAEDAPSLRGLGCERLMVAVAEKDVLAERGRAYYEAVKGSGWRGEAELVEAEGEDHVFFYMKPECVKALELRETMVAFIKRTNGWHNVQPTKQASKYDQHGNKNARIKMKINEPKYHHIRPMVSMSYEPKIREHNGDIIRKFSKFQSITKSTIQIFM